MQQIQWQDRFKIGVEAIDQAHQKLFSIVGKIMELYVERHKSKFASVEGIKYFKAYALQHFSEEEAYMREIGYPGYLAHKRHHDRMRHETLPALEQELYATDFSTEAVQRFIGVCTGWLTGHIMIEDRAITGRNVYRSMPLELSGEAEAVQAVIIYPLQELFGINVQFAGAFSHEDLIADALYYELIYRAGQGRVLRLVLVIRESLLLRAAGVMFGIELCAMNEMVRFAILEIAQGLLQRAAACFGGGADAYQLEQDQFLTAAAYYQMCRERTPAYSLLFHVERDCFALCIDPLPVSDRLEP